MGEVATSRPLSDHAFDVALAGGAEQINPVLRDLIDIPQSVLVARHDAPQGALPFEWQGAEIIAGSRQQVEREEERSLASEQEVLEVAPPVRVEAANLPVEYGAMRAHAVRDLLRQLRPGLKMLPLQETRVQRWPSTCASARKPSIFGSKIQSG